ncbi:hypothetical protein V1511DRAFT_459367 [Dipodascopsis uninucleata]
MSTQVPSSETAAAVAHAHEQSIITQVQAQGAQLFSHNGGYDSEHSDHVGITNNSVTLDVRGHRFVLSREELMSLPDSILLCLFPNGVFIDGNGNVISTVYDDVVSVDFSPNCLEYVIRTFRETAESALDFNSDISDTNNNTQSTMHTPVEPGQPPIVNPSVSILAIRPAIIVLQEDLDYYVISPPTILHKPHNSNSNSMHHAGSISRLLHYSRRNSLVSDTPPEANEQEAMVVEPPNYEDMVRLKLLVGERLLKDRGIFKALKRVRQEGQYQQSSLETPEQEHAAGTAERHLLDMLCSSGFTEDATWGFREREPNKTVINSLSLVRLLTNKPNNPEDEERMHPHVNEHENINIMAQKLLLFWRKPARKCWWDQIVLDDLDGFHGSSIKVHVRRMWTLELVSISSE